MRRQILLAAALSVATLAMLASAVVLADFGAAPFWFLLLLALPLTLGAPTSFALLGVAWLWNGQPFWAFLLCALAAGFALQLGAQLLVARLRSRST